MLLTSQAYFLQLRKLQKGQSLSTYIFSPFEQQRSWTHIVTGQRVYFLQESFLIKKRWEVQPEKNRASKLSEGKFAWTAGGGDGGQWREFWSMTGVRESRPSGFWGTAGGGDRLSVSSLPTILGNATMCQWLLISAAAEQIGILPNKRMMDTGEAKNLLCWNFSDPCFGFRRPVDLVISKW